MDGASVRLLEFADLGVWVSKTRGEAPTLERLREHERVVREALRSATPLPLRYGAIFSSEGGAEEVLGERAAEFRGTLERLGSRVEMGVRVIDPAGGVRSSRSGAAADIRVTPTPGERPGRDYLETRRSKLQQAAEARRAADELLDSVEAAFAELQLPTSRTVGGAPDLIGSLAHLVHRNQLRPYRAHVARIAKLRPELRFSVTGPWAPYSFV